MDNLKDELKIEQFVKDVHGHLNSETINKNDMGVVESFLEEALVYISSLLDARKQHRRWNNCSPRRKPRT